MTDENLIPAFPERKFNSGPPQNFFELFPDQKFAGMLPDQNSLATATSLWGGLHPPGYIGPNRKPEEKEPYGSGFIKWIKSLLK